MSDRVTLLVGERTKGETQKAIIACNDYLRMGPGRSHVKLLDRYRNASEPPVTRRLKTISDWSRKYAWQARADAYDAETERVKNERRREVMESGLALDFERVLALINLADMLTKELGKLGVNVPVIKEYRGVLADLAAETGGRTDKVDITTGGGQAVKFVTVVEPGGRDEQD